MKKSSILIFVTLIILASPILTPADAVLEYLEWSFEEGDLISYRLISDGGLVEDEIITIRIDSPLPGLVDLPADLENLDDWMQIPTVPVTAFIPTGGPPIEVEGFDNIFSYGGLAAGYWCRFAVPTGESNDTYAPLVEQWTDGPHGAIEPQIIQPPQVQQYLYWGLKYGFEFSGSIYNVTAWYYLANGDHYLANVTIVAHDSTTQAQTHYMSLFTDYHDPTVTSPGDMKFINFTVGTVGEEALWQIHDVEYPVHYEIFRNGTLVSSGSKGLYDSNWLHYSLDGLEIGVWNYTIVVTDLLMNSASDTVIVTVYSSFAIGPEILLVAAGVGVIVVVAVIVVKRR
ncbi:MAG: hypothetical protein ACFFDM_02960 [Candidatus Thorarchaeota archaeon]